MFTDTNQNGLPIVVSSVIPFRHGFTTRAGGVSTGPYASLNLGSNRGDDPAAVRENYRRVCAWLGVGIDGAAVTNQVHGRAVRIVTDADRHVCQSKTPYEADGIVTATPGLPILCFTADCVPVLLCDPEAKVVGAIHCGWRSSTADILGEALRQMAALGARAEAVRVAIGPAIGACCFETDRDVPDAIERYLGGDTEGLIRRRDDGKFLVDLRGANARRLRQLGVREENIDISDECTYCRHDKYWSHRYTHGVRGTQAAGIIIPKMNTEELRMNTEK